MNKASGTEVLLTSDDIRRWQTELQKWEATKAAADLHISEIRKKLDAAALFAGANVFFPATIESTDGDENLETMGAAAKRLLEGFKRPVLHRELQEELRKVPRFRETLDKNSGAYYYTVIKRLVKGSHVKKVGKKRIRFNRQDEAPPEGTPEGAPRATGEGQSSSGQNPSTIEPEASHLREPTSERP